MCFTQNIDTLERQTGLSDELLVEAHGNLASAHCIKCQKEFPIEELKEHIKQETIAYCECKGLVKPDIVFFGEPLPSKFGNNVKKMAGADLLIVLGTSLVVFPFAALKDLVKKDTPKMLINMTENKGFDVDLLGDCD